MRPYFHDIGPLDLVRAPVGLGGLRWASEGTLLVARQSPGVSYDKLDRELYLSTALDGAPLLEQGGAKAPPHNSYIVATWMDGAVAGGAVVCLTTDEEVWPAYPEQSGGFEKTSRVEAIYGDDHLGVVGENAGDIFASGEIVMRSLSHPNFCVLSTRADNPVILKAFEIMQAKSFAMVDDIAVLTAKGMQALGWGNGILSYNAAAAMARGEAVMIDVARLGTTSYITSKDAAEVAVKCSVFGGGTKYALLEDRGQPVIKQAKALVALWKSGKAAPPPKPAPEKLLAAPPGAKNASLLGGAGIPLLLLAGAAALIYFASRKKRPSYQYDY